jgi:hypothetical protein
MKRPAPRVLTIPPGVYTAVPVGDERIVPHGPMYMFCAVLPFARQASRRAIPLLFNVQ